MYTGEERISINNRVANRANGIYDDACMIWPIVADDLAKNYGGHPDPIGPLVGDATNDDVEEYFKAAISCLDEVREIWRRNTWRMDEISSRGG